MELKDYLHRNNIHVALIQESKLQNASKCPTFPGYSTLRRDRAGGGGGGLLTLISKSVSFTNTTDQTVAALPRDPTLEIQSTKARINNSDYLFYNIYIPPTSSCPRGYLPDLSSLPVQNKTIIAGDFNAHDSSWLLSQQDDPRGALLLNQLENMAIMNNPDIPTRKPFSNRTQPTSPDITFASPDLSLNSEWSASTELSSDHLPILTKIQINNPIQPKPTHTFLNYRKANWTSFTEEVEISLQNFNIADFRTIDAATAKFNDAITSASKRHIPAGHIRNFTPMFTPEIKSLIRQHKHLRSQLPSDESHERITALNETITRKIEEHQDSLWRETIENVNHRTAPEKLWRLVSTLHNNFSAPAPTHEAILKLNSSRIPSPKEQADILINHYASISRLSHNPQDRIIRKQLHSTKISENLPSQFTPNMVKTAIKKAGSSKARGPDNISYAHLKNLGPTALDVLTDIFNLTIKTNAIPAIWKIATIVPILKPGKNPTIAASYRPVSLLSNVSKILERLVLAKITPDLTFSPTQHGFRSQHSTTTLLTNLSQKILQGLNNSKPAPRAIVAAVDISKAFDTVPIPILISKILATNLRPNYKKWLSNFITGRQAHVKYNNAKSRTRQMKNGVPQGAVISPSLFNLFLHDLPTPQQPNVSISSYADDLTIISTDPIITNAANNLQLYLAQLENWLSTNRMSVSAQKSSITVITPFNREYNVQPILTLNGSQIPVTPTTKILGTTYDRGMTFKPNTTELANRAKPRLNVLKALTATTFGQQKESIINLYKQFIRPVLSYASMAWSPDLADSHTDTLQKVQNSALRIATGCTKSTPIPHLHAETKVLPVKTHLDMRGTQFYAAAASPRHPCNHLHRTDPTPRRIHKTPATHYGSLLSQIPPVPPRRTEKSWIHERFVSEYLSHPSDNSILGEPPPLIADSESSLPRESRVHLARLRCGHHPSLLTYQNRIDQTVDPTCRYCGETRETISHLLEDCPPLSILRAAHGVQDVSHLWSRPAETIEFLRSAGLL